MNRSSSTEWPDLAYSAWADTAATLRLWTQIVGKIRLAHTTWMNHSWHVAMNVSARGLNTSPIAHGSKTFEMEFDFIDHQLEIRSADGQRQILALAPRTVADFYAEVMHSLEGMGLLSYDALIKRDYPIMFGTLFMFGLVGLVMHLIGDLTYVLVDPRIDFEAR